MKNVNGYTIYNYRAGHGTRWVVANPNAKITPTAIGQTIATFETEPQAEAFAASAMPASQHNSTPAP